MSIRIKYSDSEKKSFELCPETCPAIEKAFFDAARQPMPDIAGFMNRNGKPVDAKTVVLIQDLLGRHVSRALNGLEEVVMHRGTFKLRAALVDLVQEHYQLGTERNRFTEWVEGWEKRQAWRAENERG